MSGGWFTEHLPHLTFVNFIWSPDFWIWIWKWIPLQPLLIPRVEWMVGGEKADCMAPSVNDDCSPWMKREKDCVGGDPASKARIGRGGGTTAGKAGKGILPHNWQGRGGSCSNLEDAWVMGIAAIISQKWVTRVEESEALTSEHSQCSLRKFHACASLSCGSCIICNKAKGKGFPTLCYGNTTSLLRMFSKFSMDTSIYIHIRQAIETLQVHCRALKFWLDYVVALVTHKRFGSVGGFWTGLRGSLVVAYCIPWAFLPRVMCGHRDGPWGLHNNYLTSPKFELQAVIFVSEFFTLYDKEFKHPINHCLPHGKVLLY